METLKKTLPLLSAVIVMLTATSFAAQAEITGRAIPADYVQTVFSGDGGISLRQASAVLQTKDGYLWIAGFDGLIRYDGKISRAFTEADGFPPSSVTALAETDHGLWVGTSDNGVFRYHDGAFKRYTADDGLPANSVRKLTADGNGAVYVATVMGIGVIEFESDNIEKASVRTLLSPDDDNTPLVTRDIAISSADTLWCVLNRGEVVNIGIEGERTTALAHYERGDFGGLDVISVYVAADGEVILGTLSDSIIRLGEGGVKPCPTEGRRAANFFCEDTDGRLWLCSSTGIAFFRPDDGEFVPLAGTGIAEVAGMCQGYEGDYWFASPLSGILHLTRSKLHNISFAASLPPMTVNATLFHDEKLYIGTNDGLIVLDSRNRRVDDKLTDALKGVRVMDIHADIWGDIWVCAYSSSHALTHVDSDGKMTTLTSRDGLSGDGVRTAQDGPDGSLVVGTASGVDIIKDGSTVRSYTAEDGLFGDVLSLTCDEEGIIYVGTNGGGLYTIEEGVLTGFDLSKSVSSPVINKVLYDPDYKGIWVSNGSSVVFIGQAGLNPLENLREYANGIFDIASNDDMLYLLSGSGIRVCQKEKVLAGEKLEGVLLDRGDGLEYPLTPASKSYMSETGVLYLACSQGVLSHDTTDFYINETPPKIGINSISIDGVQTPVNRRLTIPAHATYVTFEYSILTYVARSGSDMLFSLQGLKSPESERRVPLDESNRITFTNLPGGDYKLRLVGENRAGLRSEELTVAFAKKHRLTEYPAVKILTALLGILAIGGLISLYYRRQAKALLKRQREYREITEQAITAIADTIDAKDAYTAGHSRRVAHYSLELGRKLGLSGQQLENLYYAALLHDIGKVGLEDGILNKPGKLTDEEYEKMKRHVEVGGDILKGITVIDNIRTGAKYHHERFDGAGYGTGLAGEEIPLFARIIGVADTYDAMSSDRPYRKALPESVILAELEKGRGTQFDSRMLDKMIEVIKDLGLRPNPQGSEAPLTPICRSKD